MSTFVIDAPGPWLKPSPRLMTMRTVEISVLGLVVSVVGGALGLLANLAVAGIIFLALIVVAAIWLLLERRRVSSWTYCEGTEELLVSRGLLVKRLSVVPYGRMQFIDVSAGPAERLFKLATVQLHTAAAATDARIPGLELDEANRLRDQLAQLGETRLSGL